MRVKFAAAAAFQLYDHSEVGKEFKSPLQLRPQRPLLLRNLPVQCSGVCCLGQAQPAVEPGNTVIQLTKLYAHDLMLHA